MDNFERFSEEKLPEKEFFYSSVNDGTTGDGHKSNEGYLHATKFE